MTYILWFYAHAAGQAERKAVRGRYDTLAAAIAASDRPDPECWRQSTPTTWELTPAVIKAAGLRSSSWFINYAETV